MKTAGTPGARIALALALAVWTIVSLLPDSRPEPLPASAPAEEFSAERAMAHVTQIAQRPHPVGSPDHARVRDYVRAELARQGLSCEIQTGVGEYARGNYRGSGAVENVVARLTGTANTRAVMLAAHYDSVPTGPGAGDDAHGVAVLLETLRALRSSPPIANDVIFLITDGEEKGLLGADVFMRDHRWRREPGVVLNFEARGTSGSAIMFETSEGNEWLVRNLQEAVPQAVATSFAYEVYRRMQNDTDLTDFKRGGLAGMNFAFIEHPEFYHRPQDDIDHLDRRSVQEQGRYALSLTRRFGNQDLREAHSDNAVYFPTKFTPLIVYPESWTLPIGLVAVGGLVAATWAGYSRAAAGGWISLPLALVAAVPFLVAGPAPGVSYLFEWPVLAGIAALGLLMTAPAELSLSWQLGLLLLLPGAVFLLLVPFLRTLVVALGPRAAAPAVALAVLEVLICIAPQLVLAARSSASKPV